MNQPSIDRPTGLKDAWAELIRARPALRQRDAAELLATSEAELVASRCGDGVVRLDTGWQSLLPSLAALGPVKTITRNPYVVHETIGIYENLTFVQNIALVQSTGLDLRLFLDEWSVGFALRERTAAGLRRSFQFFDVSGTAVHKIFLEPSTDVTAFDDLVSRFAGDRQDTSEPVRAPLGPPRNGRTAQSPTAPALPTTVAPGAAGARSPGAGTAASAGDAPAASTDAPRAQSDGATPRALLDDWANLQDTHDFTAMLRRHGVTRRRAVALAQGAFTRQLERSSLETLLERARAAELAFMVFVGNRGAVQIHTGPVATVKPTGPWLNVLDPEFNLHVRTDAIESAWMVEKPTADGVVTAFELYAHDESEMAVLYGRRKPGQAEDPAWRALVGELEREADAR